MLALQATSTGRLGGLGTRLDLSCFFRSILCSNVGAPVAQSVWPVFIRPRLESWLDLDVNFAFKTPRVVNSSIGRHSSVVISRQSYFGSHSNKAAWTKPQGSIQLRLIASCHKACISVKVASCAENNTVKGNDSMTFLILRGINYTVFFGWTTKVWVD